MAGLFDWLSLGGDFLGGIIDNFGADMRAKKDREWNSREAEKNRQFQTQEREAAQDWNLEQWNRENEYNSPKAQMQRAIEAGMNPNVAMQGISGSSNAGQLTTSGQSGSVAGGKMNSAMSNFGNTVNSYWSAMLAKEQLTDLRETRPEREEETAASGEEKRESANVKKQEVKNLIKIGEKIDVEKDQMTYALERAKRFEDTELEAIKAQADKYREEIEVLKKEKELKGEQIETEESQQSANYAAANNSNAQAANAYKQGEILDKDLDVATVKATMANELGVTNVTDVDAAMMIAFAQGKITEEEWNKWLDARRQKRNADQMASNVYEMADKGLGAGLSATHKPNSNSYIKDNTLFTPHYNGGRQGIL